MSERNYIPKGNSSLNQTQLPSSQQQPNEEATLTDYFHSYPIKDIGNYMVSSFYSQKILSGLEILINIGAINVSRERQDVQDLLDHEIIGEEELKMMQQKQKKEFMKRQLESLNNQIKSNQEIQTQSLKSKKLVLSKKQHKALVQRFKKQFLQREKRHQQLLILNAQKQKQKQERHRRQIQQKQRQQQELRRQEIQNNLNANKKRKEQSLKLQKQSNEKIKQIKENKLIYQRFQQRYQNEIFLPILQQKQKKLRQIRQQKLLNIEEIKQHERSYLQKKQLHQSRRTIFHNEDWNYNIPYKSERLNVILQEQKLEKIKKLQEKQLQIQQNLNRHSQYAAYLRRNFIPKIDPVKKQEIQLRLQKSRIIQPQSLDYKTIGLTYLQQSKRKRKKIAIQSKEEDSQQRKITNIPYTTGQKAKEERSTPLSNHITPHKDEKTYIIKKRQNIKKLIKSVQINNPEKIKQLSIEASKFDESMQRKRLQLKYKKDEKMEEQALQLLLSSIQAKIGIMQTYN